MEKIMENLTKWAGHQFDRNRENREQVCCWVYRWGWTTNQILGRLLNLKRPALGDEFVKHGVLQKIPAPPGYRERFAFILTDLGIQIAQVALDKCYIKPAPYSLHESRRIPWSTHIHNSTAQHVCIDLLGPRPDQNMYFTEAEYRADGNEPDESIPDFSIIQGDSELQAEIELNHKADLRLKRWLYLRVKKLSQDPNVKIVVYTHLNSVESAIRQILERPAIPEITKGSQSGKLYVRNDREGIEISKSIRRRIEIEKLIPAPDRRTGGLAIEPFDNY
jgi:hypothetical protein